jgi:hypothetical protein
MRIELYDCNGQMYRCDSGDPRTIGAWFAEHAEMFMSADGRVQPYQISIWPQDKREMEMLSGPMRLKVIEAKLTQDSLLELAQVILNASARLGEMEAAV